MVVQFIVFLTLSTLICRGTDISKYFSECLGIRDNESRLYITSNMFAQPRLKTDCASAQSDQSRRCPLSRLAGIFAERTYPNSLFLSGVAANAMNKTSGGTVTEA